MHETAETRPRPADAVPPFRIASWNVNGLRACVRKGFLDWLADCDADVVALQEVRARPEQLSAAARAPDGWHAAFQPAERPGYSGVALYSRRVPDAVETSFDDGGPIDVEGRLQFARFGGLTVVNGYFPNGNGKNRDLSRIPYKLDFYARLRARLAPRIADGEAIVALGDWNTARHDIDLARPQQNRKTSGFRPEERAALEDWFDDGWIDTFRRFDESPGRYTWWSNRRGVRERNVGWRLDMILASPGAAAHLRDAAIDDHVLGSDHCPVRADFDPTVLSSRT